jgi:hypothetical protein
MNSRSKDTRNEPAACVLAHPFGCGVHVVAPPLCPKARSRSDAPTDRAPASGPEKCPPMAGLEARNDKPFHTNTERYW